MKKHLLRLLIPLSIPVAVLGCDALQRLAAGDTSGAISSGVRTGVDVVAAGWKAAKTPDEINPSQEYYIGRGVAANVFTKYKRYNDPKLARYVRLVGGNVAKASEGYHEPGLINPFKGYFFVILDTPQVNAFSAPGGFVFVTIGAIKAMKTEDELACVLGHEIGHITDRHAMKHVLEQKKFTIMVQGAGEALAARSPGMIQELTKELTGICSDLTSKTIGGMGEDYEERADSLGAIYAAKAGYDPTTMLEFLKRTRHGEDLK
jgi:predicted Zn-dependent protease